MAAASQGAIEESDFSHRRQNLDESLQMEEASDDAFSNSDRPQGSSFKGVNPIDERLRTLQHLVPHGLELEDDEILRVTADYVKELERKIKMFDNSREGCSTHGEGIDDLPLQKRGLCIVPCSSLAMAL